MFYQLCLSTTISPTPLTLGGLRALVKGPPTQGGKIKQEGQWKLCSPFFS